MKYSLLILITLITSAASQAAETLRYVCLPTAPTNYFQKVEISEDDKNNSFIIIYDKGITITAPAKYSDDVDTVYYFSEYIDMQIEFDAPAMEADGIASGLYIANVTKSGEQQFRFGVNCTEVKN